MKLLFQIPLIRKSTRVLNVRVQADTLEQAQAIALESAGDYEFPTEDDFDFLVGDAEDEEKRARCLKLAASAYILGDDPGYYYYELRQARKDGFGNHDASKFATVFDFLHDVQVGVLTGMIEKLADSIYKDL